MSRSLFSANVPDQFSILGYSAADRSAVVFWPVAPKRLVKSWRSIPPKLVNSTGPVSSFTAGSKRIWAWSWAIQRRCAISMRWVTTCGCRVLGPSDRMKTSERFSSKNFAHCKMSLTPRFGLLTNVGWKAIHVRDGAGALADHDRECPILASTSAPMSSGRCVHKADNALA